MKRGPLGAILVLSLVLSCAAARAACTLPYTLTNGTPSDASQVMADFNALSSCFAPIANPSFTGNVGIGTASPADALDVDGAIGLTATTTTLPTDGMYLPAANTLGFTTNGIQALEFTAAGNAILGGAVTGDVASPFSMDFGSSYGSNTPGTSGNLKWLMFHQGTNKYGIGMSNGLMEYQAGTSGGHAFYVNLGTEVLDITSGAITQPVGSLATGTTGVENDFQIVRKQNSGISYPQVASFEVGRYQSTGGTAPSTRLDISLKNAANSTMAGDTTIMTLQSNGDVGIGTTSPGYTLQVNGTAAGSSAWVNLSDERMKTNIHTISGALGMVEHLRGVRFQWLPVTLRDRQGGPSLTLPEGENRVGFLAQEVEAVVPEAVVMPGKQSNGPYYGLKEADLIPVLVEAIKEQQVEIQQLRAAVAALKDK